MKMSERGKKKNTNNKAKRGNKQMKPVIFELNKTTKTSVSGPSGEREHCLHCKEKRVCTHTA